MVVRAYDGGEVGGQPGPNYCEGDNVSYPLSSRVNIVDNCA